MVVAEGAEVGIDSEWAPFLDEAIQLAGSLVGVFLVVLVAILAGWLCVAAFTHYGKTQAAKRIFGILTCAALAGCLVSTMSWMITPAEAGGGGMGSVGVSAGEQKGLDVGEHKPKQWDPDDPSNEAEAEDSDSESKQPSEQDLGSKDGKEEKYEKHEACNEAVPAGPQNALTAPMAQRRPC